MYTNLYLVEKLDNAHRADLLQEAARDHSANLPRASMQLGWRATGKLGTLLVKVGNWLERSAQHSERMVVDA